jgi:hypothetical protein
MTDFGTSPVTSMMSKDFSRYRVRSTWFDIRGHNQLRAAVGEPVAE